MLSIDNCDLLVTELLARIPELEWHLNKLGKAFSANRLPPGVFRSQPEVDVNSYLEEIKEDINSLRLTTHSSQQIIQYLALRINRKITILVNTCSDLSKPHSKNQENVHFIIDKLTTRHQWLNALDIKIKLLIDQKEALRRTLVHQENQKNQTSQLMQLNLQRELGDVEKRLTLLSEMYKKAIE